MKQTVMFLKIGILAILVFNVSLLAMQFDFSDFTQRPDLDLSKAFANEIVANLQDLAEILGVADRSLVKHALAQLHYDVYMVGNRNELARILQSDASEVRNLIVSEYVKENSEQVLLTLNNSVEVQRTMANTRYIVEPLSNGGYTVREPHNLSEEVLDQLAALPSLFSHDFFSNLFESYRQQSTIQIEVDGGLARIATSAMDQDTIRYWEREIQAMRIEYGRIAQLSGIAEVSGPGVIIEIRDYHGFYPIEATDLRRIAGELFASGATALSLGGQRLGVRSSIMETTDGITVDGTLIETSPVVFHAIGDPSTISSGVDLLFSVVMSGMFDIRTEEHDRLTVPARNVQ